MDRASSCRFVRYVRVSFTQRRSEMVADPVFLQI